MEIKTSNVASLAQHITSASELIAKNFSGTIDVSGRLYKASRIPNTNEFQVKFSPKGNLIQKIFKHIANFLTHRGEDVELKHELKIRGIDIQKSQGAFKNFQNIRRTEDRLKSEAKKRAKSFPTFYHEKRVENEQMMRAKVSLYRYKQSIADIAQKKSNLRKK